MKKSIKSGAGFTIIELIVVVVIIAILAAIIMSNITQYNNSGKDAAIKGNFGNLSVNATDYFNSKGNYTSFCVNPTVSAALASADRAYDGNTTPAEVTKCNASATQWAACGQLKVSDSYFCVDYKGAKKTIATRATCVPATWLGTVCP